MRILLADDHDLLRQGLCELLATEMPEAKVRAFASGLDAVADAKQTRPDLAVLDVNMPHLDGVETAQQLLALHPDLAIVFMTIRSDSATLRRALSTGGKGYVLKDEAVAELVRAIREVADGRMYISPRLDEDIDPVEFGGEPKARRGGVRSLTTREREVLAQIASGLNSKEIADQLDLSSKTVDTHRRNIQAKLGMDSIAELTRIAVREGLTGLDGTVQRNKMGRA